MSAYALAHVRDPDRTLIELSNPLEACASRATHRRRAIAVDAGCASQHVHPPAPSLPCRTPPCRCTAPATAAP